MEAIMSNFKSQLGDIIKEEVLATMTRLRGKIFNVLETEDDLEIDMEKFAQNTLKKIMEESTELFVKTEEELKKKSTKLKKDPEAPKPAVNAYIMFSRDNRSDVKEENPDMKATDVTKKLAEMWREADDDLKQEYKEKSEKDKERYNEELDSYVPKEGFQNPKNKKSAKTKKTSGPKKPLNAYMWFCKDKRDELKGKFSNVEILRELGAMWKKLSDKKKKLYVDKAEEDKERYNEEMKNYVPEEGEKKKSKKSKVSDGPKRPLSAFMLFSKDKRSIIKENEPEMKQTEIMKKLGEMWKNISQKEKKKYTDQSAKLLAEFKSKSKVEEEEEVEDEEEEEDEVEDEEEEEEEEEAEEEVVIPQTGTPKKCMPNIVSDSKFAAMKAAEKKKEKEEKEAKKSSKKEEKKTTKAKKDDKAKKNNKKSAKSQDSDDEAILSDDE
jgi:hypothetical protein